MAKVKKRPSKNPKRLARANAKRKAAVSKAKKPSAPRVKGSARKNPRKCKPSPVRPGKLDTEARASLPGDMFALPRRRELPIHDAAHVRSAEGRLVQMAERGSVTRAELHSARKRIAAQAKCLGLAKANPGHGRPVTFRLPGKPPSDGALMLARMHLAVMLAGYAPARVTEGRCYWPWVARRWEVLALPRNTLLWAAVDLANENLCALYVDEDRRPVMARADVDLCPDVEGELLVWVKVTDADGLRKVGKA